MSEMKLFYCGDRIQELAIIARAENKEAAVSLIEAAMKEFYDGYGGTPDLSDLSVQELVIEPNTAFVIDTKEW